MVAWAFSYWAFFDVDYFFRSTRTDEHGVPIINAVYLFPLWAHHARTREALSASLYEVIARRTVYGEVAVWVVCQYLFHVGVPSGE